MMQNFGTLIVLDRCTCCQCSLSMQELVRGNQALYVHRERKHTSLVWASAHSSLVAATHNTRETYCALRTRLMRLLPISMRIQKAVLGQVQWHVLRKHTATVSMQAKTKCCIFMGRGVSPVILAVSISSAEAVICEHCFANACVVRQTDTGSSKPRFLWFFGGLGTDTEQADHVITSSERERVSV